MDQVTKLLAKVSTPFPSGFSGIGPLGNEGASQRLNETSASNLFENALSVTIGIMTVVAGIWFMFQFFAGAIEWLTSGGEKQAVQNAQKKLTNAITGILIVVLSYILISVIGKIVGFDDILRPATTIIQKLIIKQ